MRILSPNEQVVNLSLDFILHPQSHVLANAELWPAIWTALEANRCVVPWPEQATYPNNFWVWRSEWLSGNFLMDFLRIILQFSLAPPGNASLSHGLAGGQWNYCVMLGYHELESASGKNFDMSIEPLDFYLN